MRRNPEVGVKTIRLLGARLSAGERRLSEVVHKEVVARLASLILRFGEHRGITTVDGGRMKATRYTHNQLAGLVGSNREALTRALGKLKRAGGAEVSDRRVHIVGTEVLAHKVGAVSTVPGSNLSNERRMAALTPTFHTPLMTRRRSRWRATENMGRPHTPACAASLS